MKSLLVFFMVLYASGSVFSQDLIRPSEEIKKSDLKIPELSYLKSPKPELSIDAGGIFISPFIGFEFPVQEFSNNSKGTFDFGVKLEFAHSKIYPFVVGGFIQYESHEGTDEIKTANFLTAFKTDITSFGGSIDIILNKFLKSDFTIPFVTVEVKMMNVKRVITPEAFNPGYSTSDNVIGIGGGLGFTLFIFDIVTTYNHAGDYSTFGLKTRFHYPLIKF
jgi:hypothetical protein